MRHVVAINLRRMLAEELARRTGFALSYVEEILRGEVKRLRKGDLEAIANALGVDVTDLVRRGGRLGV